MFEKLFTKGSNIGDKTAKNAKMCNAFFALKDNYVKETIIKKIIWKIYLLDKAGKLRELEDPLRGDSGSLIQLMLEKTTTDNLSKNFLQWVRRWYRTYWSNISPDNHYLWSFMALLAMNRDWSEEYRAISNNSIVMANPLTRDALERETF